MNETTITRFLANLVGYDTFDTEKGWGRREKREEGIYWIPDNIFDPIHEIAHAFMVEDAIFARGGYDSYEASQWIEKRKRYVHRLEDQIKYCVHRKGYHPSYRAMFDLVHASPKQRSIAAFKALATDEQIAEVGL